jgi:hypothetical protein
VKALAVLSALAAIAAATLGLHAALAADAPVASPAAPPTAPAPAGRPDEYTLSIRQYADGEIIGENYPTLGSDLGNPVEMTQICSARGGVGAAAHMPVCYMLIMNPAALARYKHGMDSRMRESLKGFDQPPVREVSFKGWRIYSYFPRAERIEFAFVRTPAGVSAIADGDWGGKFQGEVLDRVTVYQQAEPRETESDDSAD